MKEPIIIISQISVLFALLAAFLWAKSATVNLPVLGSAWGAISNLEPFYAATKKIARLNAGAAASAFVSAAAQGAVLCLSSLPS
jgi:hypothetical protein